MRSALVLGFGQIGSQIAHDLAASGTDVHVMTRTRPSASAVSWERITRRQGDASSPAAVRAAAVEAGAEAIFACVHAPYDSRVWARVLPGLEATVLDVAADLDVPAVFPESVYAFAGLDGVIAADSPFAAVEAKGRIRRRLLEARAEHPARVASVIAGDLIGRTAAPATSVVRLCITDRIAAGRRALVPARTDVQHGITVIDDLAAAMIRAGEALARPDAGEALAEPEAGAPLMKSEAGEGIVRTHAGEDVGTHRLFLAPSANPTLEQVAAYTHAALGSRYRTPLAIPHPLVRAAGWFDRSMYELAELAPIWRRANIIGSADEADWRAGIDAMLG